MSSEFTRDHTKISVAKILQTLGWHSINTIPLEILTDILGKYLFQISKITREYADEFGMMEANLDHLGLAFRDLGVSIPELEEYVKYVNFGAPATAVAKYPLPKVDQLNFLKPGSKEVVTRPVHIHEHLPPMNPILEDAAAQEKETPNQKTDKGDEVMAGDELIFKKPPDVTSGEFKKIKRDEEGSRPTREISSVMMTTSGFLSPAREGKLPESKTPVPPQPELPPPPSQIVVNTNNNEPNLDVPLKKNPRPMKKNERKREKMGRELFKLNNEDRIKKNHAMKMKHMKALANNPSILSSLPAGLDVVKLPQTFNNKNNSNKFNNKALQAARLKTEKLNTTITPLPMKVNHFSANNQMQFDNIDKLLNVPDKKKVNILKKISNVKEKFDEKVTVKKEESKEDSGSPPGLIIDEPEDVLPRLAHLRGDITIEPINPVNYKDNVVKVEPTYFDDSPPGTPSTPRTPELLPTPPVPMMKEKKKRKPKVRKPKPEAQVPHFNSYGESDSYSDRPKTPIADVDMLGPYNSAPMPSNPAPGFPFGNINPYHLGGARPNLHFLANFGGPGLIPSPIGNPLNPLFPGSFPFSGLNMTDFGPHPYLPQNLPSLPNPLANFLPKVEEPSNSFNTTPEPVSLAPPRTPEPVTSSSIKSEKLEKKSKEHKKEKKDKLKKKAKKEKLKAKAEKKEEKKKIKKKEKKEKRKEKEQIKDDGSNPVPKLTLKLKSPSPRPVTPDAVTKKLNIKPVVKVEAESFEEETDVEVSSLAKISALVTGPPKPKNPAPQCVPAVDTDYHNPYATLKKKHKSEYKPIPKFKVEIKKEPTLFDVPMAPPSKYVDAEGNEVWICPACSRQDDGSPMIGCDDCDAWYHWVCVGIQVPPDKNEDWYCRHCLLKKDEDLQSDKKKKRKKKEKKEH